MAIQIVREITADVVKRGSTRTVYAKQNDVNSRFLNIRIQEDGKDIKVESTSTVMLNVERPDKEENIFFGTVNDDGTVKVPLTTWMLEQSGTLVCDVSIVSEDVTVAKLTTMQFSIQVEAAVVTDGDIEESEEYSVVVEILNRMPLIKGEGVNSVIQRNGGVTNSEGEILNGPEATGKSAMALGASTLAEGDASIAAGYQTKVYQNASAAFGGASVAGDKEKQDIFAELVALAGDEKTLYANILTYRDKYNELHPEKPINWNWLDIKESKYSFAFASGELNKAKGRASTALGQQNEVTGRASTVVGLGNVSDGDYQFIAGRYNKVDPGASFIVGGGSDENNRKNVFTVKRDGHILSHEIDIIRDNYIYIFDSPRAIDKSGMYAINTNISYENGSLKSTAATPDPRIIRDYDYPLDGTQYKYIKIRYKTSCKEVVSILWFATNSEGYSNNNRKNFNVINDGEWHDVILNMSELSSWGSQITSIRLDLPNTSSVGETAFLKYIAMFATQEEAENYEITNESFKPVTHESIVVNPPYSPNTILARGNMTFNMLQLDNFYWGSLACSYWITVSSNFMEGFKQFYGGKTSFFTQIFVVRSLSRPGGSEGNMELGTMEYFNTASLDVDYENNTFILNIVGDDNEGLSVTKFFMFIG